MWVLVFCSCMTLRPTQSTTCDSRPLADRAPSLIILQFEFRRPGCFKSLIAKFIKYSTSILRTSRRFIPPPRRGSRISLALQVTSCSATTRQSKSINQATQRRLFGEDEHTEENRKAYGLFPWGSNKSFRGGCASYRQKKADASVTLPHKLLH